MKSPSLARLGPARNQSLRCNGGAALSILYCIASPHDHMKERMKAMRTVRLVPIKALIGALVVLLCPAAWAQHAGGGALGHGSHAAGHGSTGGARPARVGTPLNPNFAPIRGVPGLGFDYEHLAAIQHSFRDKFGHEHRFRQFQFITPIFDEGLPYYYGFDNGLPYYSEESAPPQPPVIVVPPAPVIVQGQAAATADTGAESTPPPSSKQPAETQSPPPELGQLVLVQRNGNVVLAVAFTTSANELTYITREGTRRSFPLAELDKEATRQMNDANGTFVSIPK